MAGDGPASLAMLCKTAGHKASRERSQVCATSHRHLPLPRTRFERPALAWAAHLLLLGEPADPLSERVLKDELMEAKWFIARRSG